jgi:3-oxoacyl-[acyl-carrier-protein] synthase-3
MLGNFQMNQAYITRVSGFLPGEPVNNDKMESYLGFIGGKASRSKAIILRNNRILSRHYAINENGEVMYSNAEMTAEAVRMLWDAEFGHEQTEMLACGTTSPDFLLPSHASMVHGLLEGNRMEVLSNSGSCLAGFQGLKSVWMNVRCGLKKNGIATGSELMSLNMRSDFFEEESKRLAELEKEPYIAFEREFLRWMLSDGASAVLVENAPRGELSLRIDWMEATSYANELPVCMYMGGNKNENGLLGGWRTHTPEEWLSKSVFAIKQDTRLLSNYIVHCGGRFLSELIPKYTLKTTEIDWFLPHLSSMFFEDKIDAELKNIGFEIPKDKWFTNLPSVGNVGSASVFFFLDELMKTGRLRKGQRILIMVPESARFSYGYAHLTVV